MPDFERLFRPRSIAIVGASDNQRRIGGRPLRILRQRGYPGQLYPVNPKYETVQGLRCYADVDELPTDVDLYLICVPAVAATEIFERVAARGAGAAVVFAGGYAEVGGEGASLQQRLTHAARLHDVALVGPNSLGYATIAERTFGTFATMLETLPDLKPGRIALVSQSGGGAFNLLTEGHWAGVGFSHVIATGNEASLTFADYVAQLAEDAGTDIIIGYLEGTSDGTRLGAAFASAQRAGKPVFIVKTGSSELGRESVLSHTAQISGDDAAFDALFEKYGVVRLSTLDEMVDVARAAALGSAADGVVVASNSGGAAAYLSDIAEREGVPLVQLSEPTVEALSAILPAFASIRNPLDFTPQVINDPALLDKVLTILDEDRQVDLLLLYLGGMEYLADDLVPIVAQAAERARAPIGLGWFGVNDRVRSLASADGVVVAGDPARLLHGIGLLRGSRRSRAGDEIPRPRHSKVDHTRELAGRLAPRPVGETRTAVDEPQLLEVLAESGAVAPLHRVVTSADEASRAAADIGFPCVLKLTDPLLPHRAVVGAVEVGLRDQEQTRAAYERLVRTHGAREALLAEQLPIADGVELIAGVVKDQVFGSRAILGGGGVGANDADDAVTLIPPYDVPTVRRGIGRLRVRNRLTTVRGDLCELAVELSTLLQTLEQLVGAATSTGAELTEVECNPVLVLPDRTVMLDALALTGDGLSDGAAE